MSDVTTPTEHAPHSAIEQTLEIVGDRWSFLVLRATFRGVHRFSDYIDDLGVARNLLTDRLNKLVEHGLLAKVPYQDRPLRHEYRLTDKGRALSPALVALMQWGDEWCTVDDPTVLVHAECDTPLEQHLICPSCATDVAPTHIRSRSGAST